jgi:alpha-D-xyloside xylohydrolase
MGPFVQYATEKPADPIELRIYPGADGAFTLYEDEGDGYDYEKGVYATIRFQWEDGKRQLTIGDRQGSFPGMLEQRTFHVVLVKPGNGGGMDLVTKPDEVIRYDGKEIIVKF